MTKLTKETKMAHFQDWQLEVVKALGFDPKDIVYLKVEFSAVDIPRVSVVFSPGYLEEHEEVKKKLVNGVSKYRVVPVLR